MASAAEVRELEASCPWLREDFRADLALLSASTARAAQQYAEDVRVLARLAAQVPRCPHDDRGATPWTSFRREVAVARTLSDQAAAAEIRAALLLTASLPRTLALLDEGRLTVQRARALVHELEPYDAELAQAVDRELADLVPGLPPWRIVQEVRRAVARLDAEAAALRTASKNAGRSVELQPLADDQALVLLTGPAVPLTRWYDALDQRARTLKQGGDPRTLDSLRFDLATATLPCAVHAPEDAAAASGAGSGAAARHAQHEGDVRDAPAGLRPSFVEPAAGCRATRPVQANVTIPVETAIGLSNEPAWLDGYGWLSAPTSRLLLVDAELRRVCVRGTTGELVDVAARDVRPPPTATGVREAVVAMVVQPQAMSPASYREEEQHDPSSALRRFVELRDRFCDGPTGARVTASRSQLDHEAPHPRGPTAAWNLVARSARTHQLKHLGWTPLRRASSTLWFSPAGQLVEVPHHGTPAPGVDSDPDHATRLPAADELAAVDLLQLTPVEAEDARPWVPLHEQLPPARWQWLDADAPPG